MFRAVLSDVDLLKDSLAAVGEIIDEGVFKLGKDGISLIAADRAMVAVADFKILATAFEEYKIDEEKNIGLNIANLLSILKRAKAKDKLILELKDSKLELTLQNSSKRRFVLPLLDITQEEIPPIDQLEFTTKAEIKSDILKAGIDDAEVVADSVVFEAKPNKFAMRAEGDISSAELELEKGNEALLEIKAKDETRARYPLDYLKKMAKAAKVADSVVLEWGQDYPMKLSFKVLDKLNLSFILAPRVQEE
ncbi:MAG: proliferating cell nuclear antigen (pcna) [Candidatus Aenigmatarchaeota archaeon]|nr:MAG: proliferating cell nuclear antigen (pcna) [Candidatus Aenigmarchaeota archaeon]HDD71596.1 proliferating cell nuclear antigen (pcna) [Candidatus Aenigmarchaeota archaeon]